MKLFYYKRNRETEKISIYNLNEKKKKKKKIFLKKNFVELKFCKVTQEVQTVPIY